MKANKKRKRRHLLWRKLVLLLLVLIVGYGIFQGITWVINGSQAPSQPVQQTISQEKHDVSNDAIYASLQEALTTNAELSEFVKEYANKKSLTPSISIHSDVKDGEVPMFLQWDERWGYRQYGDGIMGLYGCGPTALSMVLVYLTGNEKWNPYEVAQYADAHGYYEYGSGTSWSFMKEGATELGLSVSEMGLDEKAIAQQLRQGNPIICSMGPGDFTKNGHFIVLTGIDQRGNIQVHDPNRMVNTNKTWTYAKLAPQIRNLWVYDV